MTTRVSELRKASARIEALEARSLFSGEIDHSFGTPVAGNGGLANVPTGTVEADTNNSIRHSFMAVQADGKIIVAGSQLNRTANAIVFRYLANGTLDQTFGDKGKLTISNVNAGRLTGVSLLSDGKIFLQGQTYVRLTASGAFDTAFGGGDGIATSILAGDRRSGGPNTNAVLADGSFFELSTLSRGQARLYRYKSDGSVDKTFAGSGSFNLASLPTGKSTYDVPPGSENDGGPGVFSGVGGVAVDAQGRPYVSYSDQFTNDALGRVNLSRVARLTAAGKLDTTFGTGGAYIEPGGTTEGGSDLGSAIAVTADGRVLFELDSFGEHFADFGIQALSSTGQNAGGAGFGDYGIARILPAKDGSVYVVGKAYDGYGNEGFGAGRSFASVTHLTPTLTRDNGYSADHDGIAGFNADRVEDGALTPQGDFILLGGTTSALGLVKFDGPGKATRVTYSLTGTKLVVNGSGGNDHITASNDNDEPFYDSLVIRLDDDSANVTSQDKVVVYPNDDGTPFLKNVVFNLNSGNDVFDGHALTQSVYVTGGNGADRIYGGYGNDTIYGNDGDDILVGGAGKNTIVQ